MQKFQQNIRVLIESYSEHFFWVQMLSFYSNYMSLKFMSVIQKFKIFAGFSWVISESVSCNELPYNSPGIFWCFKKMENLDESFKDLYDKFYD